MPSDWLANIEPPSLFMINILRWFKTLFMRRPVRIVTLMSGTNTWKDCLVILAWLLLRKRSLLAGSEIEKYEKRFAETIGSRHAISFAAGRMALYAILRAMGVGAGDEVILGAYTCVVVPNAILYTGARPVYVDIDPDNWTIDCRKIEEKITSRTRVIIAQHNFGSFCDMEKLNNLAKKYQLRIVEDCAHVLGAEYNSVRAGNFGDAAYFTTEYSKIISSGMGGVAVTNDDALAQKIRIVQQEAPFWKEKDIRRLGWQIVVFTIFGHLSIYYLGKEFLRIIDKNRPFIRSTTREELEAKLPEIYPARLSNLQAKIALRQLNRLEKNLRHRRVLAGIYKQSVDKLGFPCNDHGNGLYKPSYIRYTLLADDKDAFMAYFRNHRVYLGEWFNCVIHPRGTSLEKLLYEAGSCPVAEYIVQHNVNLPTHWKLKKKDVKKIIDLLEAWPKSACKHKTACLQPEASPADY